MGRSFHGGRWWGQRFLGGRTGKLREQSRDWFDWSRRFAAVKTRRFETQVGAGNGQCRAVSYFCPEWSTYKSHDAVSSCPSHQEGINMNLIKRVFGQSKQNKHSGLQGRGRVGEVWYKVIIGASVAWTIGQCN